MANVSLLLLVVVVAVVMVVVMGKDFGRCELEVRSAAADNIGAPSGQRQAGWWGRGWVGVLVGAPIASTPWLSSSQHVSMTPLLHGYTGVQVVASGSTLQMERRRCHCLPACLPVCVGEVLL